VTIARIWTNERARKKEEGLPSNATVRGGLQKPRKKSKINLKTTLRKVRGETAAMCEKSSDRRPPLGVVARGKSSSSETLWRTAKKKTAPRKKGIIRIQGETARHDHGGRIGTLEKNTLRLHGKIKRPWAAGAATLLGKEKGVFE